MKPSTLRLMAFCEACDIETLCFAHPFAPGEPLSLALVEQAIDQASAPAGGHFQLDCAQCGQSCGLLRLYCGDALIEESTADAWMQRYDPLGQPVVAPNEPAHVRTRRHLDMVQAEFPDVWKTAERMRQERGRSLPRWPAHCYLPLAGAAAIVTDGHPSPPLSMLAGPMLATVGALVAWRATQGIYEFDPDIFEALWSTPLAGELPLQLLYRLPEWCVYVACPTVRQIRGGLHGLHGFYAHLEWDVGTNEEELRFLLDTTTVNGHGVLPLPIHLGEWDLGVACQRSIAMSIGNLDRAGDAGQAAALRETLPGATQLMRELVEPLVSIVLYLCSTAADLRDASGRRDKPTRPQPVPTKHGERLFAPAQPTTWEVAYRIGAVLRAGQARQASSVPSEGEATAHRARPRAHVRRAHWGLFWTGKGRTIPRVRWLHPVLVAAEAEGLVPTVHPVE